MLPPTDHPGTPIGDGTPAIRVEGLTKRFGGRAAVADLSIEVPPGVVAGFVGPNGAGKTTTLRILLGLVRPTSGTGTVLGRSIDDPASYLHRVGGLVEGPAFHPGLSGRRNLEVLATLGGHETARIPSLLDDVGLLSRGGDPYRTYSLGMKQRLGIAGALLGESELLLLDEPSNGLDPAGSARCGGSSARWPERTLSPGLEQSPSARTPVPFRPAGHRRSRRTR